MTVVKMMRPLLTFLSPLPFFYYALSSAYFVIEKNTLTTDSILNDYFLEWRDLIWITPRFLTQPINEA